MASDYYHVADRETRLRSVTHSVGLVVLGFVLSLVAAAVGIALLGLSGFQVESTASLPPLPYASLTAIQFLGFFAVVFGYLYWRDDEDDLFDIGVPSLRGIALILGGFVALYGLNIGLGLLFQFLDVEIATNQVVEDGNADPVRFLYLIPVTMLFVAPAEELLFRGVVQGLLRRAYGAVPGVLLASALFGFGHWAALVGPGSGKLAYVLVTVALGLILGTLYELSGNIVVPIVVHGLYNAVLFVGQYLLSTGTIQA